MKKDRTVIYDARNKTCREVSERNRNGRSQINTFYFSIFLSQIASINQWQEFTPSDFTEKKNLII